MCCCALVHVNLTSVSLHCIVLWYCPIIKQYIETESVVSTDPTYAYAVSYLLFFSLHIVISIFNIAYHIIITYFSSFLRSYSHSLFLPPSYSSSSSSFHWDLQPPPTSLLLLLLWVISSLHFTFNLYGIIHIISLPHPFLLFHFYLSCFIHCSISKSVWYHFENSGEASRWPFRQVLQFARSQRSQNR